MDLLYIPPETVDDLLAITNVVDVVAHRVPLKKAGANYQACCPFHDEKTPSFTVSESKQFYHCFGCGAHGTAISFLMAYEGFDFVGSVQTLADQAGMDLSHLKTKTDDTRLPLLRLNKKVSQDFQKTLATDGEHGTSYLLDRGITNKTSELFALGLSKDSWRDLLDRYGQDRVIHEQLSQLSLIKENDDNKEYDTFRNRLMFPIRTPGGDTIGFGARTISGEMPKYLNSAESKIFKKRNTLYGLFENKIGLRRQRKAILVEGYMDVVGLREHGVDNALAALGTAITASQLKTLARQVDSVVFCLDSDNAGKQAAVRAVETIFSMVTDEFTVAFAFLPEGADPDSYIKEKGKDKFDEIINNAVSLSDFFFNEFTKDRDLDNVESRLIATRLLLGKLNAIKHAPGFKQLMELQLAEKTGSDIAFIKDEALRVKAFNTVQITPIQPVSTTPIRKAIAIAVQYPEIVLKQSVRVDYISKLDSKGAPILLDLMNVIHDVVGQDKRLTSAMVIERFRHKPEQVFNSLTKLANLAIGTRDVLEKEWQIIMANLNHEGRVFYAQQLANKPYIDFSEQDKRELEALMAET